MVPLHLPERLNGVPWGDQGVRHARWVLAHPAGTFFFLNFQPHLRVGLSRAMPPGTPWRRSSMARSPKWPRC